MRLEFRAVGSSQNVSVVNMVLGAMVAHQFKTLADAVEAGEEPTAVAQAMLKQHMKVTAPNSIRHGKVHMRRDRLLERRSTKAKK